MPNYIQSIRRVPKPGKIDTVLQNTIDSFKSLNRRGSVSITVSNPVDVDLVVQTDIPIGPMSDVEGFHDAFRSNPDAVKRFDDIASDCEKVNLHLFKVIESGDFKCRKYNLRNILIAKRGEIQNIIDLMREFRSMMEVAKPLLTVPVGVDVDMVRGVIAVASLEELEAVVNEITGERMKPYLDRISSLTVRAHREVNRVEYRSQG